METFSALLCITAEFPSQRPVARNFDVYLICVWINGTVNRREAGDWRRHRADYDVIGMFNDVVIGVLWHGTDCYNHFS